MPLPHIKKHCITLTKRTKQPCKNPAAYGCKTCRMHGARKKESIKRGEQHPNYVHGMRTLENQKEQSATSCRLQQLEQALHLLGMTNAKRSPGRKAKNYKKPESLDEIKKLLE